MIQRFISIAMLTYCIGIALSGCNKSTPPSPRPTPGPQQAAHSIRIPHDSIADVWALHLDSKRLGDDALLLEDGTIIIPVRVLGNALHKRIDWDYQHRFVSWDKKPVPVVYLIFQTAYVHEEAMDELTGDFAEVDAVNRTVIVHTCAGEGANKAGC